MAHGSKNLTETSCAFNTESSRILSMAPTNFSRRLRSVLMLTSSISAGGCGATDSVAINEKSNFGPLVDFVSLAMLSTGTAEDFARAGMT
eukprot:148810-Karenia_brevis.AAC.1